MEGRVRTHVNYKVWASSAAVKRPTEVNRDLGARVRLLVERIVLPNN